MKDVPIMLRMEEYVPDTVQRERLAVMRYVPIKLYREEFVRGMVQR